VDRRNVLVSAGTIAPTQPGDTGRVCRRPELQRFDRWRRSIPEGGSVGTSIANTIHERRDQFHSLRLGENLDRLNPAVNSFLHQAQSGFLQLTGDPVAARQMALESLEQLRQQQSSALAYFDSFVVFAALGGALALLVLLMKRSVAAKGAHAAAE